MLYLPMVRYDESLTKVPLDELYEDLQEAKDACVEKIRQTRFGAPPVQASWWTSNVGANYTDTNGIQWASIYFRELKRKGR